MATCSIDWPSEFVYADAGFSHIEEPLSCRDLERHDFFYDADKEIAPSFNTPTQMSGPSPEPDLFTTGGAGLLDSELTPDDWFNLPLDPPIDGFPLDPMQMKVDADMIDKLLRKSPQASLEESSVLENKERNKESLKRKLQVRRSKNDLITRGIYPPPNAPTAFMSELRQLERAKASDFLRHHIQSRPEKQFLVEHNILYDTRVEANVATTQKALKKRCLADNLAERLQHRPGALELVNKNILPASQNLQNALKSGLIQLGGSAEELSGDHDDSSSSYFNLDSSASSTTWLSESTPSDAISISSPTPVRLASSSSQAARRKSSSTKYRQQTGSAASGVFKTPLKFHEYKGPPEVVRQKEVAAPAPLSPVNTSSPPVIASLQKPGHQQVVRSFSSYTEMPSGALPAAVVQPTTQRRIVVTSSGLTVAQQQVVTTGAPLLRTTSSLPSFCVKQEDSTQTVRLPMMTTQPQQSTQQSQQQQSFQPQVIALVHDGEKLVGLPLSQLQLNQPQLGGVQQVRLQSSGQNTTRIQQPVYQVAPAAKQQSISSQESELNKEQHQLREQQQLIEQQRQMIASLQRQVQTSISVVDQQQQIQQHQHHHQHQQQHQQQQQQQQQRQSYPPQLQKQQVQQQQQVQQLHRQPLPEHYMQQNGPQYMSHLVQQRLQEAPSQSSAEHFNKSSIIGSSSVVATTNGSAQANSGGAAVYLGEQGAYREQLRSLDGHGQMIPMYVPVGSGNLESLVQQQALYLQYEQTSPKTAVQSPAASSPVNNAPRSDNKPLWYLYLPPSPTETAPPAAPSIPIATVAPLQSSPSQTSAIPITKEALQELKVSQLKVECKRRGLFCSGTKNTLVERLLANSNDVRKDGTVRSSTGGDTAAARGQQHEMKLDNDVLSPNGTASPPNGNESDAITISSTSSPSSTAADAPSDLYHVIDQQGQVIKRLEQQLVAATQDRELFFTTSPETPEELKQPNSFASLSPPLVFDDSTGAIICSESLQNLPEGEQQRQLRRRLVLRQQSSCPSRLPPREQQKYTLNGDRSLEHLLQSSKINTSPTACSADESQVLDTSNIFNDSVFSNYSIASDFSSIPSTQFSHARPPDLNSVSAASTFTTHSQANTSNGHCQQPSSQPQMRSDIPIEFMDLDIPSSNQNGDQTSQHHHSSSDAFLEQMLCSPLPELNLLDSNLNSFCGADYDFSDINDLEMALG